MPAGNAAEGGLVRPVLHRNVTAGETGPARVFGIHPDQASSPPRKLNGMDPPVTSMNGLDRARMEVFTTIQQE